MLSIRSLALAAVAAIVAGVGSPVAQASPPTDGLLYVGSASTITALSPETGAVQFTKSPAIASRDWSRLYSTQSTNTATVLTTSDARTGKALATRKLAPNLGLRAVSDDGSAAVLSENATTGANPYEPTPRPTTTLTVVRTGQKPRTYTVMGNVEPEAFSLSNYSLFVIEYSPPTAPDRYRVARIDVVGHAKVLKTRAVRSNEDELQEPMRGTARAQTMAPDGRRLYTLYTRDATATEPAEAFVHVLDLQRERATCVDLPPEFAASPVGAVAVSPSGTRLYVVAPAAAALAELDTATLRITRTARLPEPSTDTTVRATVAGSTTLYVATASEVTSVNLTDLAASGAWYVPGTVTGIQPASSSRTLFVSLTDRVLAVDPRTGTTQREFASINAGRIDHVAPALRPIVREGDSVQCAC
ncbi:MAG: hypothetical protein WD271_03590 [Acidimicrobiia bacterium]